MITRKNIPIVVVGLVSFIILISAAAVYSQPTKKSVYEEMKVDAYQPGLELVLVDRDEQLYTTMDYDSEVSFKEGDFVLVHMEFTYIGNQHFALKHIKVIRVISNVK